MGFRRWLLMPSIPDVRDAAGVVNWFLEYDEVAEAAKGIPEPHLANLRSTILAAITEPTSAVGLQILIDGASASYQRARRQLADFARSKESGALASGKDLDSALKGAASAAVLEACCKAMLRIYCHVLDKRHNTAAQLFAEPIDDADPDGQFGEIASLVEDFSASLSGEQDDALFPPVLRAPAVRPLLQATVPTYEETRSCLALACKLRQQFLEMLYVRNFCVYHAIVCVFSEHREFSAMKDAYETMWSMLLSDEQFQAYEQRFAEYADAVLDSRDDQSPAQVLGVKFAKTHAAICGSPEMTAFLQERGATGVVGDPRVSLPVMQYAHRVMVEQVAALAAIAGG